MALTRFRKRQTEKTAKDAFSEPKGLARRIAAVAALPFVLVLIVLKPNWFEPND